MMQPRRIAVSAAETQWPCFKVAMTLPSVFPLMRAPRKPCPEPQARCIHVTTSRRIHTAVLHLWHSEWKIMCGFSAYWFKPTRLTFIGLQLQATLSSLGKYSLIQISLQRGLVHFLFIQRPVFILPFLLVDKVANFTVTTSFISAPAVTGHVGERK